MCKVVVNDAKKDAEFILYNHLFSRENYKFTVSQLVKELQDYNLNLTQEFVQAEIDDFIEAGLVNQNFRCYSVCGR